MYILIGHNYITMHGIDFLVYAHITIICKRNITIKISVIMCRYMDLCTFIISFVSTFVDFIIQANIFIIKFVLNN